MRLGDAAGHLRQLLPSRQQLGLCRQDLHILREDALRELRLLLRQAVALLHLRSQAARHRLHDGLRIGELRLQRELVPFLGA